MTYRQMLKRLQQWASEFEEYLDVEDLDIECDPDIMIDEFIEFLEDECKPTVG